MEINMENLQAEAGSVGPESQAQPPLPPPPAFPSPPSGWWRAPGKSHSTGCSFGVSLPMGPCEPLPIRVPDGSVGKESVGNAGDLGSIPGLGRSPGDGKGYPLQYSDLENSMDCTGPSPVLLGHNCLFQNLLLSSSRHTWNFFPLKSPQHPPSPL